MSMRTSELQFLADNQHEMIKSLQEDCADGKNAISVLGKLVGDANTEIVRLLPYVRQTKDLNGKCLCICCYDKSMMINNTFSSYNCGHVPYVRRSSDGPDSAITGKNR